MKRNNYFYNSAVKHVIIGVASGCIITFVGMLICSFILTIKDFSASAATPMSNVCLSFGAFVCGFVCTILHKSRGLVFGFVSGFVLFAVVTIISLFVNSGSISINSMVRLLLMTVLSATGGVFGVNQSAKRKMI